VKKTILKAWPEMEGFAPLLTSPSETSTLTSSLFIDFSRCYVIDSCGLTAFLLKIMQYFKRIHNTDLTWETNSENEVSILRNIIQLGFFKPFIQRYYNSLFSDLNSFSLDEQPIKSPVFGATKTSFPIIYIDFTLGDNRRKQIKQLKEKLFCRLLQYNTDFDFKGMQFISILFELAKNSADHSEENAVLGLDIFEAGNAIKINFLYGDFGLGIKQHIQNYLKDINDCRWKHLSLTDAYHLACEKGFTSKPFNGINFGTGLSTVIEFSKIMNMRLSVFDASSRGLLSNIDIPSSHRKIRGDFFVYSRNNPFSYFGTLEANKK
jgi:hypothetical protein